MKIRTACDPKPIPCTDFDWEAWDDSYGADVATGYGKTEAEAIVNLREILEMKFGEMK